MAGAERSAQSITALAGAIPFNRPPRAVNGVNTAIGVAAGALMARTQATAAGVAAAAGGYSVQEVTAAGEMAAVTQVRVV